MFVDLLQHFVPNTKQSAKVATVIYFDKFLLHLFDICGRIVAAYACRNK